MAPGSREQVHLQYRFKALSDRSGDRSAGGRRFHVVICLTASLPQGSTRRPVCRWIPWMKTGLDDLKFHNLTLPEAVNVAQNVPQ